MKEHPITPPPELVQQIADGPGTWLEKISKAYCAGSDQELDACCQWLSVEGYDLVAAKFRAARCPKPLSLKEQALEALDRMDQLPTADDQGVIRRALESLPD